MNDDADNVLLYTLPDQSKSRRPTTPAAPNNQLLRSFIAQKPWTAAADAIVTGKCGPSLLAAMC